MTIGKKLDQEKYAKASLIFPHLSPKSEFIVIFKTFNCNYLSALKAKNQN